MVETPSLLLFEPHKSLRAPPKSAEQRLLPHPHIPPLAHDPQYYHYSPITSVWLVYCNIVVDPIYVVDGCNWLFAVVVVADVVAADYNDYDHGYEHVERSDLY